MCWHMCLWLVGLAKTRRRCHALLWFVGCNFTIHVLFVVVEIFVLHIEQPSACANTHNVFANMRYAYPLTPLARPIALTHASAHRAGASWAHRNCTGTANPSWAATGTSQSSFSASTQQTTHRCFALTEQQTTAWRIFRLIKVDCYPG